jgi:hypothetical protein
MTQAWERELQKLRSVNAPDETVGRVGRGPTGDPFDTGPGPRQRILAAVVAIAVFGAAGAFAYAGFADRTDVVDDGEVKIVGPVAEPLLVTFSFRDDENVGVLPLATLTYGDDRLQACTSGADVELTDGRSTNFAADCNTPRPIEVPQGTLLAFDGEGEFEVEMRRGPPTDAAPGIYDLDLSVTWVPSESVVEAEAAFVASIEIVDPAPTEGEPLVLTVQVDDRNRFEPYATLTYSGEERDLFCRSYTVMWVGGGGDGMMTNCGPGTPLAVPVGTELEIVSEPRAEVSLSPAQPTMAIGRAFLTIDVTWPRNDVWRSAEASFQARLLVVESVEPSVTPSSDLLVGSGMVLEEGVAAPEFCLGGVLDSFPPQCSGVPLRGWDWSLVEGEQTSGETTWGDATIIGRFEGETFVVSSVGPYEAAPDEGPDFTPPCEEPQGGWVVTDPTRASDEDRTEAIRDAEAQPDHTASWISYLTPPTDDTEDPGLYVLVLGFAGDLERHRREAEELWGGPLCIFQQERTYRELRSIQRRLEDVAAEVGAEMTFSSGDVVSNQVEMGVIVSSPQLEQALVERFGEGAVRIVPALRPVR